MKKQVTLFLEQIRFYQFSKNLLIFVPLFSSHLYDKPEIILEFCFGFITFCCIASSGYILNDTIDLESDKLHPTKMKRPLASGAFSVFYANIAIVLFFATGMLLAIALLPFYFQCVLLFYYLLVCAYSRYLKKVVLVDVFTLASFYSLRIIGGMLLIPNGFSIWLITFSFFFFLSLAYIKRYSELLRIKNDNVSQSKIIGRNYFEDDLQQIGSFGVISAFTATLVLMLYIDSDKVISLYHTPQLLWLTCLVILFWLLRMWTLVGRGQLIEDPIIFALRDKISLLAFILVSVIYVVAIF